MNGTLIRVIPKTLFDFGYLPTSTTDNIIVAKAVNVIPYDFAYLWVRVYRLHIDSGSSAAVKINVTGALPSEDTQESFLETTSTTLSLTGTPPVLLKTSLTATAPLPPYLQIDVEGEMGATRTYAAAEISIDLHVRCCG